MCVTFDISKSMYDGPVDFYQNFNNLIEFGANKDGLYSCPRPSFFSVHIVMSGSR